MSDRLIFCLTTGRSGTMYLAHILDTVPGVCALHEPWPNFVDLQKKPYDAKMTWLSDVKIPWIRGRAQPVYVETSNLFSHGFVKPLADMGIEFDAIRLRRDLRDVAISQWRRGHIPGRSAMNRKYGFEPDFDYRHLTDYQLCYWFCLTKDRMADEAMKFVTGKVYETETGKIISQSDFMMLLVEMGLPAPDMEKYDAVKNVRANPCLLTDMPHEPLPEKEAEVRRIWQENSSTK